MGAAALVFLVIGGLVLSGNVPSTGAPGPDGPAAPVAPTPPSNGVTGGATGGVSNISEPWGNLSASGGEGPDAGGVSLTPNGSAPGSPNGTGATGGPGWSSGALRATVAVGAPGATVGRSFFALDIQTPNLTSPWLWNMVNSTPFTYYSFGDAGETTDQVTDSSYAQNGTVQPPSRSNDTNFVAFCREIHCHAIMSVPAEINNVSMDVATVQYVEDTLGFHPDYWEIGNEPQGWTHFGIPWTSWQPTDASNTTPLGYALEVQRIVPGIRSVDPMARIIGIESADGGSWSNSEWLDEVAAIDGRNLSAVAIHPYPDGAGPANPTLASFEAGLTNRTKFPNNYDGLQANVDTSCGCSLPILVGEYNSALNGTYAPFEDGYAEVPYLAAGYVGALEQGIPQVAFFSWQHTPASLVSAANSPLPIFTLFSTFFRNLTLGQVYNTSIDSPVGGLFGVVIENGSRSTLLMVNTNVSLAATFDSPTGLPGAAAGDWQSWLWAPEYEAPIVGDGSAGLTGEWTIPAQGVLMLNASA